MFYCETNDMKMSKLAYLELIHIWPTKKEVFEKKEGKYLERIKKL